MATGDKIEWRKFDSGATVIAALASDAIDTGYAGSSPLAAEPRFRTEVRKASSPLRLQYSP
jgi:ABC-type taurine transport system substrate-binding protein